MLINGQKAPVLGRVCMDQCALDVTGIPSVQEGSVVTVYGRDAGAVLPIEQIAEWMDTIHYEVVCSIGHRVPRVYLDGEKQVSMVDYLTY
jgi:alanine racemase